MFLQLFIISRSGGLIYNQDLSAAAPHLTSNDWLRFGSTFHGLHAIAGQIAPVVSGGIEKLETGTFKLQCFQTRTGTKFVVTAEAGTPDVDAVLAKVRPLRSPALAAPPLPLSLLLEAPPGGRRAAHGATLAGSLVARLRREQVYEAYADYVLKNPFYELEMPIRIEAFASAVSRIVAHYSSSHGRAKGGRQKDLDLR